MTKLIIVFRQPPKISHFETTYNSLLALIERMPHVTRRQVNAVTGSPTGPSPYYRVLEVYFDSQQLMAESLRSPRGQEAGGELRALPPDSFEVMFADVYEEAGGSTPATVKESEEVKRSDE
jgi:uncharacterized protein (TIGR02118 family)